MARDEEYLLYPIDTGDDPVCLRCGSKMLLAGSEVRPKNPTLLTFRCDRCGQSEKFLSDEP
jgi:DNA-directed RNA polymerase subunit RPC12/RpoP